MGSGLSMTLENESLYQQNLEELDRILVRVKSQDRELTDLDLSNRFLGVQGAQYASGPLAKAKHLRSLNLSYNNLGNPLPKKRLKGQPTPPSSPTAPVETAMPYLIEGLKLNASLLSLNLSGNNLQLEGVLALCEVLKVNTKLSELILFNNRITDEAIPYLCEALQVNTSLKVLNLDYNEITDQGACYLREMLKQNEVLMTLGLSRNEKITPAILQEIEVFLQRNRQIQLQKDAEEEVRQRQQQEAADLAEQERVRKEAQLKEERERIEREYKELQEKKNREMAEQQEAENAVLMKQEMKLRRMDEKKQAEEEHIDHLINLAYEWRATLQASGRRGREYRSGFSLYADEETMQLMENPIEFSKRRPLQACWCEPTDQTVPYSGKLHYHCIHEPLSLDQLDGGDSQRYEGCRASSHKCRSIPVADTPAKNTFKF